MLSACNAVAPNPNTAATSAAGFNGPPNPMLIRTVEIVGLDLQADGGTHVRNTSEVGSVRVADYKSKGAINKRIYIEIV